MPDKPENQDWKDKQIPLKDIVLSNSWAMQAILQYLEEVDPGARDRIWAHYQNMKAVAETSTGDLQTQEIEEDGEVFFEDDNADDWMDEIDPGPSGNTIN
jgi:hypothetical protein